MRKGVKRSSKDGQSGQLWPAQSFPRLAARRSASGQPQGWRSRVPLVQKRKGPPGVKPERTHACAVEGEKASPQGRPTVADRLYCTDAVLALSPAMLRRWALPCQSLETTRVSGVGTSCCALDTERRL